MFSRHALFYGYTLAALLVLAGSLFWLTELDYLFQVWISAYDTQPRNNIWRFISLFSLGKVQAIACLVAAYVLLAERLSLRTYLSQALTFIYTTYFRLFICRARLTPPIQNWPQKSQIFLISIPIMLWAGTLCALLKYIIGRPRPKMYLWHNELSTHLLNGTSGRYQSMPSGHTVTTFAILTLLWPFFPRLRWAFLAYALLSAAARVMSMTTHYISDVFIGAGLGIAISLLLIQQFNIKPAA